VTATELWTAVDALVDRAPLLSDLRTHGLHLVAARRMHELGRPVPEQLATERRLSAVQALAVRPLLKRARAAIDGPLAIMKGPEVAARYADPATRPFRDLDLLTADAAAAQRALLAAGFAETGEPELYVGIHHLRPLVWPGLPLVVELHERPKWVRGLPAPPARELLGAAVPSATGVDGVLALSPAHHVLAVAAHSWAHVPLSCLLHVVDVAALLEEADPAEVAATARRWGLARVWRSTLTGIDWALHGRPPRSLVRLWAGNLRAARERTVLESHVERCTAAFSALPPGAATAAAGRAVLDAVRPEGDEPARAKLRRSSRALRNASARLSEHQLALERGGQLPPASGAREQ
jgi:hypothetical protein